MPDPVASSHISSNEPSVHAKRLPDSGTHRQANATVTRVPNTVTATQPSVSSNRTLASCRYWVETATLYPGPYFDYLTSSTCSHASGLQSSELTRQWLMFSSNATTIPHIRHFNSTGWLWGLSEHHFRNELYVE